MKNPQSHTQRIVTDLAKTTSPEQQMFTLCVERAFYASHTIKLYDGSWEPVHAHNWLLKIFVAAPKLDEIEVVMDFHLLEQLIDATLEPLTNAHINDHAAFAEVNPTAERICQYIFESLKPKLPEPVALTKIWLREADGCWAIYEG